MLQVHAKQGEGGWAGQGLEFSGAVRLGSEQGRRLKGAPAVFVGESASGGPKPRRNPGLWGANCAQEPPREREFLCNTCWGLFTEGCSCRPSFSLYALPLMTPEAEGGINGAVSVLACRDMLQGRYTPNNPEKPTEARRARRPPQVLQVLTCTSASSFSTQQHTHTGSPCAAGALAACSPSAPHAIQPDILFKVNMALFDGRAFLKSLEEQ